MNTNWPAVAPNWGALMNTGFMAQAEQDVQQILELPADDLEHSIVEIAGQYLRYKRSKGIHKPATIESHLAELIVPLTKNLVIHPRRRDEMERLRAMMVGSP